MFRLETKIDKAFWSGNRCKSRRESTWARSIRNMCEWKPTTAKWIMVTFAIPRQPSSIKAAARTETAIIFIREQSPPLKAARMASACPLSPSLSDAGARASSDHLVVIALTTAVQLGQSKENFQIAPQKPISPRMLTVVFTNLAREA